MTYFANANTVNEVKALFRNLAKTMHPDKGGTTEGMQELNAQYQAALKACDGQSDGTRSYSYDEEGETLIAEMIAQFFSVLDDKGVELLLVGTWLWISGDTKPHKDTIKALGFRWSPRRKMWFFTPTPSGHRYYRGSFDDVKAKYGAERIAHKGKKFLKALG